MYFVGKFSHNFPSSFKLSNFSQNFPTAAKLSNFSETFQLKTKLSNFARFFPTSIGSFQLRSVLSNFAWLFPTTDKLSNFRLSNLKLSNFSFFPTALSNYTYPFMTFRRRTGRGDLEITQNFLTIYGFMLKLFYNDYFQF